MRFAIVVYPGSNCDRDVLHVLRNVMKVDADLVWHKDSVEDYDCIILPGGFSYGDYLRAGAIAAISPISDQIRKAAREGKPILGICNGFQILVEMKLLPGALMVNRIPRFICKWVRIRVETTRTPFTMLAEKGQVLRMPIAHGEGNYYIDEEGLRKLIENDQIVFRYVDERGEPTEEANPNGSVYNIAGVCNEEGNVVGLMPHPERASEKILSSEDGRVIFQSVIEYLRKAQRVI